MTSHIFEHADQLELFKAHASGIDVAFYQFHQHNPKVYELLVKFARQAKAAGRKKFGMKMLFERVRWFEFVETKDSTGFRLNNNYTSRYARLMDKQERCSTDCEGCDDTNCLVGLFETRELTTPSDLVASDAKMGDSRGASHTNARNGSAHSVYKHAGRDY